MMAAALEEVAVADLRLADFGSRVVLTRDGVAVDGTLSDLILTGWINRKTELYEATIGLVIKKGDTSVRFSDLPLDYRLQVEREEYISTPQLDLMPAIEMKPDHLA